MFNLFKKKTGGTKIIDKVLMTQSAKWKVLSELCKKENNIILVFWFDETLRLAESRFNSEAISIPELLTAREIRPSQLSGKKVVFQSTILYFKKKKSYLKNCN